MNPPSTPDIATTPDGYHMTWTTEGITADITGIRDNSDGVVVDVEIRTARPPRMGVLRVGRLTLMSTSMREQWTRVLAKREPDLDWDGMLEQMALHVRDARRKGDATIESIAFLPPRPLTRWLIEPFVPIAGPSVMFAMGGTGKSMVATAIAVTASSGVPIVGLPRRDPVPVLYCDWETDADTVAERMRAIAFGANIAPPSMFHYRRQYAPLSLSAPTIRSEVARLGAGMLVIDSMGMARGGEPESAELTIQTFAAIRTIGVPTLVVDHVTKAAGNDSETAFGSVYTHNAARMTWAMDKAEPDESTTTTLALINKKWNDGRLRRRMGYTMTVVTDDDEVVSSIRFDPVDLATTDLQKRASIPDRIRVALTSGGKTTMALAVELDVPGSYIRARLADMKRKGEVTTDEEGRNWLASRASN